MNTLFADYIGYQLLCAMTTVVNWTIKLWKHFGFEPFKGLWMAKARKW